jgi:CheY-like chemotaxis protein
MTNNPNDSGYTNHVSTILLADDDADDRLLMQEALLEANFPKENLSFVEDGVDLMDRLFSRGRYANVEKSLPDLILLDLNMPRKDGRQALKEIKSSPTLRHIPVVVFTTSTLPEDIYQSYDLGANSYITKPQSFEGLESTLQTLKHYWTDLALVP